MNKLFKKTILITLLAVFLWGGVGFNNIYAQDSNSNTASPSYSVDVNTPVQTGNYWKTTDQGVSPTIKYTPSSTGNDTSAPLINNTGGERNIPTTDDYMPMGSNRPSTETLLNTDGTIVTGGAAVNAVTAETEKDKENRSFAQRIVAAMGSAITGALGKTVMAVNGILLQAIAIPLMSFLLRIAAAMLDAATKFSLSTQIYKDTYGGVVIVWELIRNIFNITFIFILLYTAIRTITSSAGIETKKIISNVIIAALIINFSLFITRIVIDTGNLMGATIYNKLDPRGLGLDVIFMHSLGAGSIFGLAEEAAKGGVFSIGFGVVSYLQLFTILASFIVFLYATILLAARTVMLVFLCALSPIGFMGNVLPKFSEYSKMWRETLYGQVMIAPIFLLFVYLITLTASSFNKLPSPTSPAATAVANAAGEVTATALAGGATSDYLGYFKYLMIIMLLVVAVKITKKMTGAVGAAIEKVGMAAAGVAVGLATGGVALAGRATMGRLAAKAAASEGLTNAAAQKGVGGFAARMALKGADKTSKATFDMRNTGAFKKTTGLIGEHTGLKVDYGKSTEGGYQGMVKRQGESAEATAKLINKGEVGVKVSEKFTRRSELDNERRGIITNKKAEKTALGILDTEEKKAKHTALEKEINEVNSKIGSDTDEEITKSIEEKKMASRRASYEKQVSESFWNKRILGSKVAKEKAKKVRDSAKDKNAKKLMEEAIAKMNEEEAKKKGSSSPPPPPTTTP